MEYIYRYSNNLYDKLKHILGYYHRDTGFIPYAGKDFLSSEISRLNHEKLLTFRSIGNLQYEYTGHIDGVPIGAITNRILNFINN